MRFIPSSVHGLLDYVWGITMLSAPNLLGFSQDAPTAALLARLFGSSAIAYSLLTRYELGVLRLISYRAHLLLDRLGGAALVASPWLFGFADQPARVWGVHVIGGLISLLVPQFSKRTVGNPSLSTRHA